MLSGGVHRDPYDQRVCLDASLEAVNLSMVQYVVAVVCCG